MTDFVTNRLQVEGLKEERERLVSILTPLLFEKIMPIPSDIEDEGEWCSQNWGTPCEPKNWEEEGEPIYLEQEEGTDWHACYFDTNWDPPNGIIEKLSLDYPSLRFTLYYFDPALERAGYISFEDSEEVDSNFAEEWDVEEVCALSPFHEAFRDYLE